MTMTWNCFIGLLARLAIALSADSSPGASCDDLADGALVQLSHRGARLNRSESVEEQFGTDKVISTLANAKLCRLIRNPTGKGPICTELDCSDPVFAMCCPRQCGVHPPSSCTGFNPACQVRKAACEMVLFLADDANPLLQPQLYVAPGTYYPADPGDVTTADMGGYDQNLWQVLQNLTSICLGDGFLWLRNQSSFIKSRANFSGYDEQTENLTNTCPTNPESQADDEEGKDSMQAGVRTVIKTAVGIDTYVVDMALGGGVAGVIAGNIFSSAMGLAQGQTNGAPTNPCTYAKKNKWGECVWGQVQQYVERYVTSYVQKALQKYNKGQLRMKMSALNFQLAQIKKAYLDNSGDPKALSNVVNTMGNLFVTVTKEVAFFVDSQLLTPFLSISLNVQGLVLSSKRLRSPFHFKALAGSAVCYAKVVLKRATYLMQSRMAELKGIQVNRTSLRGDGHHWRYYYSGPYDAECQTTENDALKDSPYICDPEYGESHTPHHSLPQNRQGKGDCGNSEGSKGNIAWKNWMFHQAFVRRMQQQTWGKFLEPVVSWLEIAQNLEANASTLNFTARDWVCKKGVVPPPVADVANLSNPSAGVDPTPLVQMFASCPFEIERRRRSWHMCSLH
ncbi:unnamed protein product [Symbiodinium natans]|uniref:Uncharacterized protein n=1 Tax=Symbiodinium natans TaxID=878477 RepID=A0A812PH04_9DINO|nr:unnamed protein product [Symbiodinium natans]